MDGRKFTWLGDDGIAANGLQVERGKDYDIETFTKAVVAHWVRTGSARYADAVNPAKRPAKKPEEV